MRGKHVFIILSVILILSLTSNAVEAINAYTTRFIVRSSDIVYPVQVGDLVFYRSYNSATGWELYKTDGTTAGTGLVKDLAPGSESSSPGPGIAYQGKYLFRAWQSCTVPGCPAGSYGNAIFISDGTAEGTQLVKVVNTPETGFTVYKDIVYFSGVDLNFAYEDNWEPWRTDGTTDGTYRFANINTGASNWGSGAHSFTVVDDLLYFATLYDASGSNGEIYFTDGTPGYAVPATHFSSQYPALNNLTECGGRLFYSGSDTGDGNTDRELWTLDETGEIRVMDIRPGTNSSDPYYLITMGNRLFFEANDGTHGSELWTTDCNTLTTIMPQDVYPGANSGFLTSEFPVILGNNLYFTGYNSDTGMELWKSDGTPEGTVIVKDICSPACDGNPLRKTATSDAVIFFAHTTAANGIWQSDGTEAGTIPVVNAVPVSADYVYSFFNLGEIVLGNVDGRTTAYDGIWAVEPLPPPPSYQLYLPLTTGN
jgi:ELWxxDGT repeat protein